MRIALVGLGGMGTTHYLNYLHIPDAQVVAAVGQSEQDRARAAQWGLPLYATLTELCAAEQADLADICAPTFLHKPLALEAIRHGPVSYTHLDVYKRQIWTLPTSRLWKFPVRF